MNHHRTMRCSESLRRVGLDYSLACLCTLAPAGQRGSRSLRNMRAYLRVLSRDPAREQSPGFKAFIRTFVADAPGVISVIAIRPHSRGGFSVIVDRVEELPDAFDHYFERSELMLVI